MKKVVKSMELISDLYYREIGRGCVEGVEVEANKLIIVPVVQDPPIGPQLTEPTLSPDLTLPQRLFP